MIKAEEIIDKIWAEHDHDKDDNYVYTDGWTDACDRFYQELQGKSIIEWHKPSEKLPKNYERVLCCFQRQHFYYEIMRYYSQHGNFLTVAGWRSFKENEIVAWASIPKYEGDNDGGTVSAIAHHGNSKVAESLKEVLEELR